MLLALLTSQRIQTLKHIKWRNVVFNEAGCDIYIDSLLKTSKPGTHQSPLKLKTFSVRELCVVAHLKQYISFTKDLRGSVEQLLFKPHNAVSPDTIARWIKSVMQSSGIDTQVFGAHSTRSASTSKLHSLKVPMNTILAAGGWTNAKTFATFYKKKTFAEPNESQLLTNYTCSTSVNSH